MTTPIPDPEWVQAVLRHSPLTRQFTISVREVPGNVVLEGLVPTMKDRQSVGSVALSAVPVGVGVKNFVQVDPGVTLTASRDLSSFSDERQKAVAA